MVYILELLLLHHHQNSPVFLFVHNATNPSKEKLEPKILLDHFMVYIKGMHYVLENVRKHCWSRLKINRLTIVLTFDGGKGKI